VAFVPQRITGIWLSKISEYWVFWGWFLWLFCHNWSSLHPVGTWVAAQKKIPHKGGFTGYFGQRSPTQA